MKKMQAAMKERTETLNRLAELEEENTKMRLHQAEHRAETAKLAGEVAALKMALAEKDERLKWITMLSGSGYRPRDLPDSKPR